MERLVFELDWLDGEGIQGPELAATFARVQIRVRDSILTRAFDHETNAVRDFVLVPLYPLAEWLASNWWTLMNESENPASRRHHGFHGRHCLGAEREGYGFPRLELVSWGARTRIVSATDPMPRPNSDLVHVAQTMKWVSTHELFETLADLVDQVLRRLASLGFTRTALEGEWVAVRSADDDESSFCRAAARLGWDPYAIDHRRRDQVLVLAQRLGGLFDEAAPFLDPNDLEAGSRAIVEALQEAKGNALPLRCLGGTVEGRRLRAGRRSGARVCGECTRKTAPPSARRTRRSASDPGGGGSHGGRGSQGARSGAPAGRPPCQPTVRCRSGDGHRRRTARGRVPRELGAGTATHLLPLPGRDRVRTGNERPRDEGDDGPARTKPRLRRRAPGTGGLARGADLGTRGRSPDRSETGSGARRRSPRGGGPDCHASHRKGSTLRMGIAVTSIADRQGRLPWEERVLRSPTRRRGRGPVGLVHACPL